MASGTIHGVSPRCTNFRCVTKNEHADQHKGVALLIANKMAEREGFEPSIRDKPYTPLAGERLQPLGHLSTGCVGYLV